MAKLLPEWKNVGTSRTFAGRSHRRFREQICRSASRRRMPRETVPSIREGFKSSHGLQWRQISGGTPYLASKEELIAAGLGFSLKKCLTVTGGGCEIDAPVHIKLFIGKSAFLKENGRKTASRPVERVQVKFTKSYFPGNLQWSESCLKKRLL